MPRLDLFHTSGYEKKSIRIVVLALVFLLFGPAEASRLDELIAIWRIPDYPGVMPPLTEYRKGPYGRNVQVDYMIATSLCRISGGEELGQKYFQRIMAAYELSRENRQQIEREYDRCVVASSATIEQPVLVAFSIGHSDVGVRGKTFYWLDQKNGPLGGDPIKTKREIPAKELKSRRFPQGEQAAAVSKVRKIAGSGFDVIATEHFIIASSSGQSKGELEAIGRHLDQAMKFFHMEFGMPLPEYLVTIYLAPNPHEFVQLAERVHGLEIVRQSIGYSFRDDYSIAGVVKGAHTGTLKHELFHLMARNHFGDIPPWLDEGMAALYEVSRRDGDRIEGLQNWRGDVLRRFWEMRPTLEQLVQMDWRTFDGEGARREQQAANHATARYLALYLQQRGELAKVYKAFQQQRVEDLTGDPAEDSAGLLRNTLERPLSVVDAGFVSWFQALERPLTREAMADVQRRLNSLGFNAGEADGLMGRNTKNALKAFQRSAGLTATGRLDTTTFELLKAQAVNVGS